MFASDFEKWQNKLRRTLHLLAPCNFLSMFSLHRRRGGGGTGKLFSFLSSCPPTPLPLRYRSRAPLPLQHRSPSAAPPSLPSRPHSPAVSQSVRRHLHSAQRPSSADPRHIYLWSHLPTLSASPETNRRMLKHNAARMESLFDSHTPDARARA